MNSPKMLIGFAGGCITHQSGIPYPQLFHRVLMRWLDERGIHGIRFIVARDPYEEPNRRVESLLAKSKPDLVIMHRSAHTFFTKSMAVFYARGRYVLNPYLVNRRQQKSWNDYEQDGFSCCLGLPAHASRQGNTPIEATPATLLSPEIKAQARELRRAAKSCHKIPAFRQKIPWLEEKLRRLRPKELPWLLGELSGLLQWAIEDELEIVSTARSHCSIAGAKLLVVGPGLRIGYPWVNRHAQQLDNSFQAWAMKHDDASYVSLLRPLAGNRSPNMLSAQNYLDAIHFNGTGHKHLAARLEPVILQAIEARHAAKT